MNIDFHAHILPAADHGSDGLQTSLRQLDLAEAAKIDLIAATPHFYPRREELHTFLARRERAASELRNAMGPRRLELRIGAEVQLCKNLHRMKGLEALCLEGTNILLLELPPDFSIRAYESTLDSLMYGSKLTVVLAHIDRYHSNVVEFLLNLGFLAQLNAESFCHLLSKKRSLYWSTLDSVVALGSDIHGTAKGYSDFLQAKRRLGSDYSAIMHRTEALLKAK